MNQITQDRIRSLGSLFLSLAGQFVPGVAPTVAALQDLFKAVTEANSLLDDIKNDPDVSPETWEKVRAEFKEGLDALRQAIADRKD